LTHEQGTRALVIDGGQRDAGPMSDPDDLLSARDVDVDAERFVDPADDSDVPERLGHPDEGSDADVLDQHLEVPADDDV